MKISHFSCSFFRNRFPFDFVACFCAARAVTAVGDIPYGGERKRWMAMGVLVCASPNHQKICQTTERDPLHKYHFDDINELRMEIYI